MRYEIDVEIQNRATRGCIVLRRVIDALSALDAKRQGMATRTASGNQVLTVRVQPLQMEG